MERPVLTYEQQASGVHVRIWEYEDGRFLFERLNAAGKGTAVFCPNLEKAMELRVQYEAREDSSE